MTKEAYANWKTVRLMVEKGFDPMELLQWTTDYDNIPPDYEDDPEGEIVIEEWSYPLITLQRARRWLLEKYNLFVEVSTQHYYGDTKDTTYYKWCWSVYYLTDRNHKLMGSGFKLDSQDQAEENGIVFLS